MSTEDRPRISDLELQRFFMEERRVVDLVRSLRHTHGVGEVARVLTDLRAALELRFVTEEAPDGFFDMIGERGAGHFLRGQQCRREHVALIRDVDRALDRVRACLAGPIAEIVQEARTLADHIEQHEKRERDLLVDAMSTDAGTGG